MLSHNSLGRNPDFSGLSHSKNPPVPSKSGISSGKHKILLTLLFAVSMQFSFAQNEWAPIGAKWYYDYPGDMGWLNYTTIESVGDTIIQGKSCRILQMSRNIDSLRLYTYSDSNIVWVYKKGNFYKLYDFNANPGDTWEVIDVFARCDADSMATVRVDSVGYITINSTTLKYIVIKFLTTEYWGFQLSSPGTLFKIIETIGPMGYMFPQKFCHLDYPYPNSLRCYSDSLFGFYETGIVDSCTYIATVIKENNLNNTPYFYPNPCNNIINIDFSNKVKEREINIYNIYGEKIKTFILYDKNNCILDISDFNSGYYILNIKEKNNYMLNQKIIKL